ncbi:hypothetical protein MRQ36_28440 [Micromonospora sp. R77]|uniref:hypothetical protein n=1 Tax=Micromonospora sp. R77 TaxID=2925836 RepID=UPI001F60E8D1|nr:hypothetical protein [Micromonospora sp. R77]MCI4066268.1 hypothetical protein [Micromonospora sp. R77]
MGSIRRAIAIATLAAGIVTGLVTAAGHGTDGHASADQGTSTTVVMIDTPWE